MTANINTAYKKYIEYGGTLEDVVTEGEGIVRYFSSRFGNGFDNEDLYQTGMLGLMRAVESFDPLRGSAFSTWACACVISEIRHYVRREESYRRGLEQLECFDNISDSDDEIKLSDSLQKQRSFHLSLDDKIMLDEAFEKLKPLQHKVVVALFYKGMTQQQTANALGITQRKVSRVKTAAIGILKCLLDPDSFHLSESKDSFHLIKSSK